MLLQMYVDHNCMSEFELSCLPGLFSKSLQNKALYVIKKPKNFLLLEAILPAYMSLIFKNISLS